MISSRWLALMVFVVLLSIILYRDNEMTLKNKFRYYGVMFLEGMVGGIIIDGIGVNAGYYFFPRQPLYSLNYFLVVVPCWGVFGMLLNCLWDWFGKDKFIRSMAVSVLPLFIFYEGANIITQSWIYMTPFYVVAVGWLPLGWTFAGCNKRRRVVFKIESIKLNYQQTNVIHMLIRASLDIVRWLLIIVMFPLLLVMVAKTISDMAILLKGKSSVSTYKQYLKVRVVTWLAMS